MAEDRTVTAQIQRKDEQGQWQDTGQTVEVVLSADGNVAIREGDIRPFLFGYRALIVETGDAFTVTAVAVNQ